MSFSLVIVGINVIVISLTIGDSSASVYDIKERLQQHLFSNYSKHVRPTENGESIVLDVTFYLLMLLDVDEKLQIMKTRGWTEQRWRDGRLVWDPDDFGEISRTIVPTDWLWMPTVANLRSANDRYYMAETKSVGVYYNGTVRNIPQDVMETPCTLDIRQFPFDKQRCTISFVPWNLLQHELTIRAKPEKAILWYLLQNTEWDVVGSSSSKQFAYSDIDDSNWTAVDFTLHLKRKPLYYIVNIISPSIVLGVLTLLVFFLPCDAGEKLSFSVSILIATSLYSVIVSDIMPVTSESVPFILQLLYFNTGIVAVSIGISIFMLRVHHRSEIDLAMNSKTRRVFLEILPPFLGLKPFKRRMNAIDPTAQNVVLTNSHMDLVSVEDYGELQKSGKTEEIAHSKNTSMIYAIAQNVKDISDTLKDDSRNSELLQAWKYLSVVLDRLCFFILLSGYICGVFAVLHESEIV